MSTSIIVQRAVLISAFVCGNCQRLDIQQYECLTSESAALRSPPKFAGYWRHRSSREGDRVLVFPKKRITKLHCVSDSRIKFWLKGTIPQTTA